MSKVTKLSIATDIVKAAQTKAQALAGIQEKLGVSRSNAFVYYTKATKGVAKPDVVKDGVEAVKKVASAKSSKKLSDIDSFIASVKAEGQASPFAGLGV